MMAVPERWMVSNPSADVDDEPDTDDASETAVRFVDLMEELRKSVQRTHLPDVEFVVPTTYPYESARSIWRAFGEHALTWDPHLPSFVGHNFARFTGEGIVSTTTGDILESFGRTTATPDVPLLQAVARATDEQKEQIWRVLGVSEPVTIRKRSVVGPNPQTVASDWLEDALNVKANPTPISLEDWYSDESA
jgi:hypothetical protein